MTQIGSTYATLKAAIVTQLSARSGLEGVDVLPAPPADALKVHGPTGAGKAIWIADAEGDQDNTVLCGEGRLDIDETYSLTIVLQALPIDNEAQTATDLKVDQMLGELLLELASDPTWGLVTGPVQYLITSRGSFRRFTGPLPGNATYPSRCEFDLDVEARISFDP